MHLGYPALQHVTGEAKIGIPAIQSSHETVKIIIVSPSEGKGHARSFLLLASTDMLPEAAVPLVPDLIAVAILSIARGLEVGHTEPDKLSPCKT